MCTTSSSRVHHLPQQTSPIHLAATKMQKSDPARIAESPYTALPRHTHSTTDPTMEQPPYSTFYVVNAQGLSPQAASESRWKIPYLSDSLLNSPGSSVPFLAVTVPFLAVKRLHPGLHPRCTTPNTKLHSVSQRPLIKNPWWGPPIYT